MSTRCNIHFNHGKTIVANIYRHSDGYPESVKPDLIKFFNEVINQTRDTHFDDPAYLAAKFVVWQAGQYADKSKPLDFISLGIVQEDAPDGEYVYTINCDKFDKKGFPKVTFYSLFRLKCQGLYSVNSISPR
jgi:hypothetical protein